jgi:hypothetical protein
MAIGAGWSEIRVDQFSLVVLATGVIPLVYLAVEVFWDIPELCPL